MVRFALERVKEVINDYDVIVGILPTGYGKSKFLYYNRELFEKLSKVIHVLPLRSIVAKLAKDIANLGDVGYQAGIFVEDIDKTPFLTSKYTIATFDSFLLNFYGIPVSEIWRSNWHSDVAFTLARCSHIIFDEVHLVITPDSIYNINEEFRKIVNVIRDSIRWFCKTNLKAVVFTATLYPWLIKYIIPNECKKVKIIVYAPQNHQYYLNIVKEAKDIDIENFWNEKDDFYVKFKDYHRYVKTYFHFKSVDDVLNNVLSVASRERIVVMFNSVRRCIELFEKYSNVLDKKGIPRTIIHGRMSSKARSNAIKVIEREKSVVVFATQAIEAGIDTNFDILITEVAPPHSLIQRTGRIARYGLEGGHYEVHIVLGSKDVSEGVKKLCGGIYDVEGTLETVNKVLRSAVREDDMVSINVNWRLPELEGLWDYLKILCIPKEIKMPYVYGVEAFLARLTYLRPGLKWQVLKELDKRFGGSFIRASALLSIYLGPVNCKFNQEFLSIYVIPVSIDFLKEHYKKVLDIEDNHVRVVVEVEGIVKVEGGPEINYFLKYPNTSIFKILRKIRGKYGEVFGEYVKVVPLGLLGKRDILNREWGYVKWWK